MYRNVFALLVLLSIVFQGCKSNKPSEYGLDINLIKLKLTANLRGLSLVDENVVWASGTNGIFIKTNNGGSTWQIDTIEGTETLDFRSIEAFNENIAIVVSAGTPACIYLTRNGGISWKQTWHSEDSSIFLDAISFWDQNNGLVMGDPIDGKLFILKTKNGGNSWEKISGEKIPKSLGNEGGFAASGTCLALTGNKNAWIGTGGDSARVYATNDAGSSWSVINTPVLSGSPMKGIYSLSFKNQKEGIAVGGEWNVENPLQSKAVTEDGGLSWSLGTGADFYCSGSCYALDDVFLACGQSGIDISINGGKEWRHIDDTHLYGIAFDKTGKTGFGTGPEGRLVKLSLSKK